MRLVLPVAPRTTLFSRRLRLSTLLSALQRVFLLDICTCTVASRWTMEAAALAAALQALAVPRLLMWYQLLLAPGDKPLLHLTVTLIRWYVALKVFGGENTILVAGLRYVRLRLWVFVQFLVVFKAGIQRCISFLSGNSAASVNLFFFNFFWIEMKLKIICKCFRWCLIMIKLQ